jgi:hypothetical protein
MEWQKESTLKCIKEVTEGRGKVRLGLGCRILVSEMLRGNPEDEFDEELSEVDDEHDVPSLTGPLLLLLTTAGVSVEAAGDDSVEFERLGWLDSCMRTEKRLQIPATMRTSPFSSSIQHNGVTSHHVAELMNFTNT